MPKEKKIPRPSKLRILEIEQKKGKNGQLFTPVLKASISEKWSILNTGKIYIDKEKGTYKFSVKLIPEGILKQDSGSASYKMAITANVDSIYYDTVISGRSVTPDLTVVSFLDSYPKVIKVENADRYNPQQLRTSLPDNLLMTNDIIQLITDINWMFCYAIRSGGETIYIPCSEIARFFYLTGKTLSKEQFTYDQWIPTSHKIVTEEETNKKVYVGIFDYRLTEAEIKILALLSVSKFAYKRAELMFRRLTDVAENVQDTDKNKMPFKFIKALFPYMGTIRLGVTGFYLDKQKKYFFVTQIHQSEQVNSFFDRIDYLPFPDYRSLKDEEKRSSLPNKKGNKSIRHLDKIENTDPDQPNDIVPGKPNYQASDQTLDDDIGSFEFFDSKDIQVIKKDKIDQEYQYPGVVMVHPIEGNKFSSEEKTSGDKTIGSLREIYISKKAAELFKMLIDAANLIAKDYRFSLSYLQCDPLLTEFTPAAFGHINNIPGARLLLIELIYLNQACFYLLDISYDSDLAQHYIGFVWINLFDHAKFSELQQLINAKVNNKTSWHHLNPDDISKFRIVQMNRQGGIEELKERIIKKVKALFEKTAY